MTAEGGEGWLPEPPGGYTLEEWELIIERDVLDEQPPPFVDRWVIYCDIDGFSRIVLDPAKRVRVAHVYWDIVRSLAWGARHHRVLAAADTVRSLRDPSGDARRRERQKAALDLWRSRVRIFSDSVFVFLDPRAQSPNVDAAEYSLDGKFVADVAASVSRRLWVAGLPHRGGIAFGRCLIDLVNSVFIGEPIVHAYQTAQCQEWLGYAVHPDSADAARSAFGGEPFVFNGQVPVRTRAGSIESTDGLYVLPFPTALMALREGTDVDRDQAVEGLLTAAADVAPTDVKVLPRYARTARMWLGDGTGMEDRTAARIRKMAELVPSP